MIPGGATQINELISVVREGKEWTYFCGVQPVFRHAEDDRQSFRMFTAQLCCQGACTQAEIIRTCYRSSYLGRAALPLHAPSCCRPMPVAKSTISGL